MDTGTFCLYSLRVLILRFPLLPSSSLNPAGLRLSLFSIYIHYFLRDSILSHSFKIAKVAFVCSQTKYISQTSEHTSLEHIQSSPLDTITSSCPVNSLCTQLNSLIFPHPSKTFLITNFPISVDAINQFSVRAKIFGVILTSPVIPDIQYFRKCFFFYLLKYNQDFLGGMVGKESPANTGDMGSNPGPGEFTPCRAPKPCTTTATPRPQLKPECSGASKSQLLKPMCLETLLHNERETTAIRSSHTATRVVPAVPNSKKFVCSNKDPSTAKNE